MSVDSSSIELDKLVRFEVDEFHKAMEMFKRDASVPGECSHTELCRRMSIVCRVGQCKDIYKWWKTSSALTETWMDRDMWENAVRVMQREAAASTASASGGASAGVSHVSSSPEAFIW